MHASSSVSDFEELRVCPVCGTGFGSRRVLTERGARFDGERAVICLECGLVFLDRRLTPEALERYYRSDTFSNEVRGAPRPTQEALAYRDMRAERRWRLMKDLLPSTGRCLEIGCGAGNFLRILEDAGYDAVGVDPSVGYVEYARESGLHAVAGLFPEALPNQGPFDLVFTFHVLEHVPDPAAMLREARDRVAPGGMFVIEYPDVELAARRWILPHTYFERAHLFDFSEETLGVLLARAGFKVRGVVYEEKVRPYDRNVLLVCDPVEPRPVPNPGRPERAHRLARRLALRLGFTGPLMPLRPLWRRLRGRPAC